MIEMSTELEIEVQRVPTPVELHAFIAEFVKRRYPFHNPNRTEHAKRHHHHLCLALQTDINTFASDLMEISKFIPAYEVQITDEDRKASVDLGVVDY